MGYSVPYSIAEVEMAETVTYEVPGVHCAHCEAAIKREVGGVEGVERVDVDLETKAVTISGSALDDARLREAIDEAGYDVA
jgi:copper chaperone CopZ